MPAARIRNIRVSALSEQAPPGSNSKVSSDMKLHAEAYYTQNRAANEARGVADKNRKILFKEMKAAGVESFNLDIPQAGGMTVLDVAIETPTKLYMDPAVLFVVMGCDKDRKKIPAFLELVSVTKAAIVEQLGSAIALRCEKDGFGKEDVFVKVPPAVPAAVAA